MDNSKFTQLCVWQGTSLEGSSVEEFEKYFKDELGCKIKFSEAVVTLPDRGEDGDKVENTGGRTDLFFYIHEDDMGKFAIRRLAFGIRWWEDVIGNREHFIYPIDVIKNYPNTWVKPQD